MTNDYTIVGDVVYITLPRLKKPPLTAMIDLEDLPKLEKFRRVCNNVGRCGKGYAQVYDYSRKCNQLHRIIMNTPDDWKCQFRTANGYDCRKSNLENVKEQRPVTRWGRIHLDRYIYRNRRRNSYFVRVTENGKRRWVGYAKTKEQARVIRDKYVAAREKKK